MPAPEALLQPGHVGRLVEQVQVVVELPDPPDDPDAPQHERRFGRQARGRSG